MMKDCCCLVKDSQKVVENCFYYNYNYYICNKNEMTWKK